MNRSLHQSRDHEPAGAGVPPRIPSVTMPGPLNRLVQTTLPITPALGAFVGPKNRILPWLVRRWLRQLALATGTIQPRTAHTPPHPKCLPGRSRALPTLQEWGRTVVATTHLACTLSPSKCLTLSDWAHMARTCLFVIWPVQLAQLTKHHQSHQSDSLSFWAHTCKSSFCLNLMPLGASVTLGFR